MLFEVWAKRVADRLFAEKGLSKALLVEVACCNADLREVPREDVKLKAWIGFLHPSLEDQVNFGLDAPDVHFPFQIDAEEVFPFASSLVEVANERYSFQSAESGPNGPVQDGAGDASRLDRLESAIVQMPYVARPALEIPPKTDQAVDLLLSRRPSLEEKHELEVQEAEGHLDPE